MSNLDYSCGTRKISSRSFAFLSSYQALCLCTAGKQPSENNVDFRSNEKTFFIVSGELGLSTADSRVVEYKTLPFSDSATNQEVRQTDHGFFCKQCRKKGQAEDKQTPPHPTINSDMNHKRTTNRPSFLCANNAERKHKWTTNRPSFFVQALQEGRYDKKANQAMF